MWRTSSGRAYKVWVYFMGHMADVIRSSRAPARMYLLLGTFRIQTTKPNFTTTLFYVLQIDQMLYCTLATKSNVVIKFTFIVWFLKVPI